MAGDTDGPGGLDDEVRADALDVLGDAVQWRLTQALWADVRVLVGDLAAAVRDGDDQAAGAAVAELELLGPVRATRGGTQPTVPAPDEVREEVNALVPTLDGRRAPSPPSSPPPSSPPPSSP